MNIRLYISKNDVKGKLKAAHLLSPNGPKWRKRRWAPILKRVNGRGGAEVAKMGYQLIATPTFTMHSLGH